MLLAAALAAAAGRAAVPPVQSFGVQDLVRLQRLSDVETAPDGARLTVTLRTTDMDANRGRTGIWLIDSGKRGAPPLHLAPSTANDGAAQWSADGRFVYFLSTRSSTSQVWRVAPGGGSPGGAASDAAPLQVTQLPLDVGSFRISPRGDRLLVSMEVYPDCEDLACTEKRLQAAEKARPSGKVYEHLFMRHWDAWSDGRRSQLFTISLDANGRASAAPVRLSAGIDGDVPGKPFGGREDYAFSPDGAQVVFSVRAAGTAEPWSTNFDLYAVAADGGTPRNLTAENPAWDARPAFSPDGAQLAYLAMDRPGFEADRFHLVLMDVKSGVKHALTQNWDRSIARFSWSRDGKTLFATADHLGQHPLWAIDAVTGRASAITGDGTVESFSVGERKIFYTQSTLGSPADAFSVAPAGGKPTQLTRSNQALLLERKLGTFEQFSFAGWNGENVFAYLMKPALFKHDVKYPLAVVIHGGPQGSLANGWQYRWNAQALAGAGYAVLLIDFHGSTGYGQAFTDSISRDWGGKPLEDIKDGVAAALKKYPWLDGTRMCALGGSYGGYLVNWIAGQWPDGFKCLVSHAGIFDTRAMYYSTEELWFEEWENGGPQYQNPESYEKFNPVDFVGNWQTPMLVIHGQLDYRVPYAQGVSAFTALQRRAIPSQFLFFPDESHWVLKPEDSVQWYDTVIGWMNRWTRE
jgi:dipeptidyl aminopeptidase/acylaminoacyl peptidase